MNASRTTRVAWGATLLGLVLFTGVAVAQGFEPVADALLQAGWRTLWLVPLFAVPLGITTWVWRSLFRTRPPAWSTLAYGHWVGFGVNQLLPVARVGGELVRARVAVASGSPPVGVVSSLVADKTAQVASVALTGALGLGLLSGRAADTRLVGVGVAGAILIGLAGAGFYVAQRRGLVRWSGRLAGRLLPQTHRERWTSGAHEVERELAAVYQGPRLALAVFGHVAFRLGLAVEVFLLAQWFGHPVTWVEAVILEGTNQLIRAASFAVPGALGVQETGFVVLGEVLGVPAPLAFSLSLGKRAREVLVGVPALVHYQLREGLGLFQRSVDPQPTSFE
jgi:putative membrane protein